MYITVTPALQIYKLGAKEVLNYILVSVNMSVYFRKGWLGGAVLDVYAKEPLPRDSPIWDLPGVTISPHMSGWSHNAAVSQVNLKKKDFI